jgi:predicted nucleic acid-binding protein
MILYVDSSAIVKEFVAETGSAEIQSLIEQAESVGTASISYVEVIATLHKAIRMAVLTRAEAEAAVRSFRKNWPDLVRTRITDRLVKHAAELAWNQGLRGYDSVQLASAAAWQQALGRAVVFASFDLKLARAARSVGLMTFPGDK